MKTLPRWAIWLIIGGVIALAVGAVSQFGNKSLVYVEGELELDDALQPAAKGIRTLFIILHDEASAMPMPFGAVRFPLSADAAGKFHSFVITQDNLQRMNPERSDAPKSLRVKARLDRDGAAGMDAPGDLVGEAHGVALGERIHIRITKLIP